MSSKVRSALIKAVVDLNAANWNYTIVGENSPEAPNHNEPWLGLNYIPDIPDVATLGDGGEDDIRGILQVDVFLPLGKGEKQALDVADSFRSYFTAGRRLSYSGQEVVIVGCGRSSGFVSDNFFRGR